MSRVASMEEEGASMILRRVEWEVKVIFVFFFECCFIFSSEGVSLADIVPMTDSAHLRNPYEKAQQGLKVSHQENSAFLKLLVELQCTNRFED